jgi:ankyrin repeat protein
MEFKSASITFACAPERGRFKFHDDFVRCGYLCTATRDDSHLWSGLSKAQRGPRQRTHLMYACKVGNDARVQFLVQQCRAPVDLVDGPSPRMPASGGQTALHYAAAGSSREIIDLLLRAPCPCPRAKAGGVDIACEAHRAERVNVRAYAGWTPLLIALQALDVGPTYARVRVEDARALRRRAARIPYALLHGGADPNSADSRGLTPLHWAARLLDVELILALAAAGAEDGRVSLNVDSPLPRDEWRVSWQRRKGADSVVDVWPLDSPAVVGIASAGDA